MFGSSTILGTLDSRWWEPFLHPSPLEFCCGGIVALAVLYLILMRTRWGQARPVAVCIVLSVFAHGLLLSLLYGTRLSLQVPVAPAPEPVAVQLFEDPIDRDQPEPPESQESDFSQAPWESVAGAGTTVANVETPELATPSAGEPDASPIERQVAAGAPLSEPPLTTSDLQPQTEAATPLAPETADLRPTPFLTQAQPVRARTIESLLLPARRREMPAPQLPFELGLPSDRPRLPELAESTPDPLPGGPGELAFDPTLQRLTEKLLDSTADARSAEEDEPSPSRTLRVATTPTRPESREPEVERDAAAARPARSSSAAAPISERIDQWIAKSRPRLGDGQPLPAPFRLRQALHRRDIALARGGSQATEEAVQAALVWLADHQQPDGRWDAGQTGGGLESQTLGHDRGGAGADADTGITGLAILAFLAAGETHLEGDYRQTVEKGLSYLMSQQDADGNLAGKARLFARMYCHGMSLCALSEAYGMTGDHRLRESVERGIAYTVEAQHPNSGGWRYQPGDRGDMSQFGWQVLAIKSAQLAGLSIPQPTHDGMRRFLASCCRGTAGGLASYRPGEQISPTMTAEALVSRLLLEGEFTEELIQEAQREIARPLSGEPFEESRERGQADERPREATSRNPGVSGTSAASRNFNPLRSDTAASASVRPERGRTIEEPLNLYYLYYGTLAMYLAQGDTWPTWNRYMQTELLESQMREGPHVGSWQPDTMWGSYGGRVYSTAMATLCLEVYYRYLPLYGIDSRPDASPAETARGSSGTSLAPLPTTNRWR